MIKMTKTHASTSATGIIICNTVTNTKMMKMAKISNTFWVHTALIKVERFTLVCLLMILVRPLLIVMVDRIPTKHLPEVVYLTVVRLSLTQNVTSVWNHKMQTNRMMEINKMKMKSSRFVERFTYRPVNVKRKLAAHSTRMKRHVITWKVLKSPGLMEL